MNKNEISGYYNQLILYDLQFKIISPQNTFYFLNTSDQFDKNLCDFPIDLNRSYITEKKFHDVVMNYLNIHQTLGRLSNCISNILSESLSGHGGIKKLIGGLIVLELYLKNLIQKPWKKEFHQISLDSGMYIGWVKGLIGVDDFFENIGYIQEDNYMILQRPPPIQQLELVCLNIRLGMIQCFIAHHIHQRLSYTHHHTTLPQVMLMLQNYNPQPCVSLFSPPLNSFTSHFNHNLPPKPPSFFKNQLSLLSSNSSQNVNKKVIKVPPPVPKKNFHLTPLGLTHLHHDTQQSCSETSDKHHVINEFEVTSQDMKCEENSEYQLNLKNEICDDETNSEQICKNDENSEFIMSGSESSGNNIMNDSLRTANKDLQRGHLDLINQKCDLVFSIGEDKNNYYNMVLTDNNNNGGTYINLNEKHETSPGKENYEQENALQESTSNTVYENKEEISKNIDYVNECIDMENNNADSGVNNADKASLESNICENEQAHNSIYNITSYQNNSYFDICNLDNDSSNKNNYFISNTNKTIDSSEANNSNLDNYQNSELIFSNTSCENEDLKNINVNLNNSDSKTQLINNDFVAYSSLQECHMSDGQNMRGRLEMNEKMFRIQATEKWIKDNEYNCFRKSSDEDKYIRSVDACEGTQQNILDRELENINKGIYYGFPKVSVGKEDLLFKSEEKFTGPNSKTEGKSDEKVRFIAKNELEDKQTITFSTFKKSTEDLSQPLPPPPPPPLIMPHLYSNISSHHHHYPPPPPPPVQHHHPQCKHYHQRPPPLPPNSQTTINSEGSLINQLILKKFMHDDSSDV